jgi:UDP-2-acetamido-3-amino-2,3-dideoxy-glucuronate N-acetyltransferase
MPANFYQHSHALVESTHIGAGTRIWAFAHVLPGATIGEECNICDHVYVENCVLIGNRVTVKCGVQLWDGVTLEDDVFVGPNVTFTNDPFPRSKRHLAAYPHTVVKRGASIGANATILPGLTVGTDAMIGAGAVVTRHVPPNAIVVGNPARIVGYAGADQEQTGPSPGEVTESQASRVKGARLMRAPLIKDLRGNLSTREVGKGLPFLPKRYFVVMDVPSKDIRGEHAHRKLQQLLVCLRGSVSTVLDDGNVRQEFRLDSPELALYLPPMVWGIQYKYSADALLLVMASEVYDADDYIRDYEEFLSLVISE